MRPCSSKDHLRAVRRVLAIAPIALALALVGGCGAGPAANDPGGATTTAGGGSAASPESGGGAGDGSGGAGATTAGGGAGGTTGSTGGSTGGATGGSGGTGGTGGTGDTSGGTAGGTGGTSGGGATGGGTTSPNPPPTAPAGTPWSPRPGTSWQWQLSGTVDTSFAVQAYDIDLFDTPASTIASLKARGVKVVCYFSAGTYEDWRPDAASFPASTLGNGVQGWAGEKWLDVRSPAVASIMQTRMDLAVQKGCDAVEPDNVDGYANASGFPLTGADQLTFDRGIATAAHARALGVALKNDLDQIPSLVSYFDFALDEQCFQYGECSALQPFIAAGKAVFEVEYGSSSLSTSVCPKANAANFDTLIKDLNLDAQRTACR